MTPLSRPSIITSILLVLLVYCITGGKSSTAAEKNVPFGSHATPAEVSMVTLDQLPEPEEFYKRYIVPGVPVLMKSAAKEIPAYNLWTDEYMALVYLQPIYTHFEWVTIVTYI